MAIFYSTQYDNLHVAPITRMYGGQAFAGVYKVPFTFANPASGGASAIGDLVYLVKVPSVCEILMFESLFRFSAWDTNTTIEIGWLAYTEPDGDAVVADDNGLLAALDVDAAGWWYAGVTHTSTATIVHNSPVVDIYSVRAQQPVILTAVFRTTAPTASDTLSGYFTVLVP